jgi:serine/threonine-protein kinase
LFLKGRIHFHRRGRHIRTALECFQRAVALDPNFAQAHIALADALSLAGFYGVVKPSLIMTSAHASALQAVERAPELAESHAALALWLTLYSSERDEALARWDKAMSIGSPTPQVRCSYALWRCGLLDQRWAEARDVTYQALASDPLSGYAHTMIAMLKMAAQDTEGLLDAAQRGVELDNESFWSQWGLQRAYHAVGMREEAIAHGALVTVNFGRHPWAMGDLAFAHAAGGDPAAAEALYDELMLRARTEWVAAGSLAFTATQAGRLDDALAHCERAVAERDAFVRWAPLQEYSGWAPLYTHPGWPPVRRRILDW